MAQNKKFGYKIVGIFLAFPDKRRTQNKKLTNLFACWLAETLALFSLFIQISLLCAARSLEFYFKNDPSNYEKIFFRCYRYFLVKC
jgi:hypothetical protein